jgi:hypothetical protein
MESVRALPGSLRFLCIFHRTLVLCGAFVCVRRELNSPKRRFRARAVAIAAGERHSAALSRGGRLYTWGSGADGRLGHGDDADAHGPRLVDFDCPPVRARPGRLGTVSVSTSNLVLYGTFVWAHRELNRR